MMVCRINIIAIHYLATHSASADGLRHSFSDRQSSSINGTKYLEKTRTANENPMCKFVNGNVCKMGIPKNVARYVAPPSLKEINGFGGQSPDQPDTHKYVQFQGLDRQSPTKRGQKSSLRHLIHMSVTVNSHAPDFCQITKFSPTFFRHALMSVKSSANRKENVALSGGSLSGNLGQERK
jgi:hypothetical protein